MGTRIYPFIDIAVADQVRPHFLAGDAIVILTVELDTVIWANGPGAVLLGHADIEQVRGAPSNLGFASRRQIAGTPGFPAIGANRSLLVRVTQRLSSHAVGFLASEIVMPDGVRAIMLVAPDFDADKRSPQDVAARAIHGIAEAGHHAALIDAEGVPLASSRGFRDLGISDETLRDLADDALAASDGLVKRLVAIGEYGYPVGIARLSVEPARCLVIAVDDPQPLRLAVTFPAEPAQAPTMAVRPPAPRPVVAPIAPSIGSDADNWFFDDAPATNSPTAAAMAGDDEVDSISPARRDEMRDEAEAADAGDEPSEGIAAEPSLGVDDNDNIDPEPASPPADDLPPLDDETPIGGLDLPEIDDLPDLQSLTDQAPGGPTLAEPEHDFPEPLDVSAPDAHAAAPSEHGGVEDEAVFTPDFRSGPVRFVWRTDAFGRFSTVSEELAASIGEHSADVIGKPFRDVASALGLDPDGEIAGLLERRDTWSGRTVMWPIEGTDLKVPVDLAALPVYGRDRSFEGFRGFGVVRLGDAVIDEEALGLSLAGRTDSSDPAPPADANAATGPEDPFAGETPAIAVEETPERRASDKVIRLAEHRAPTGERGLSPTETSAFREIGARLKEVATPHDSSPDDEAESREARLAPSQTPTLEEIEARLRSADRLIQGLTDRSDDQAQDEIVDDARDAVEEHPAFQAEQIDPEHLIEDEIPEEALPPEGFGGPGAAETQSDDEFEAGHPDDLDDDDAFADKDDSFSSDHEDVPRPVDTSILERLPVPVLIHAGDVLHFANEEFFTLTGYGSLEDLHDAGGLDVLFVDTEKSGGDPDDHRRRLRTRDGQEFPVEALLQSVPWGSGKALLLALKTAPAVVSHSATDEELAELESRVTEMSTILDTATDGIVIIGNDGTIRSISRPAEALFGFDTAEVAGKPFASLFAVESQRAARDYLGGLSDNGVASVLNDGREVIGREAQGRFIPLFMTIGKLPGAKGYCAVLRDITQWKRAEEELTQARAEAERASSQKTDFLARISHEIRTPLNAIIGFSELMIDEKFGPIVNDRYRDYLRDINRSGNHVLDLVNDLLDISKIEAGEQEMSYEAVSLNETLAEAVAMMQPQANRDRVIIRSSYASRLPEVVADLRSIRQIALNLLSNAVRYTQAGGQVIVSTSYEPTGDVVLRVRDTGVGMTQGEIEQALKPFRQINALKRPRGDGTGLGLPLTKAMVEANRARFSISSAPDEGTLVEIVFPSQRVLAG